MSSLELLAAAAEVYVRWPDATITYSQANRLCAYVDGAPVAVFGLNGFEEL